MWSTIKAVGRCVMWFFSAISSLASIMEKLFKGIATGLTLLNKDISESMINSKETEQLGILKKTTKSGEELDILKKEKK